MTEFLNGNISKFKNQFKLITFKHAQLLTLGADKLYKKAFDVCVKMLDKKLNISETTKSINIEKQNQNPIALTIDSVDTHNSNAVVELSTDLTDIDAGIIDFDNVKSMLVGNQHDFEDNDAELLQKLIDGLDIDIGNINNEGIGSNKNENKKVDFINLNLEQTWKQNFDHFSKLAKDSKEEYRSSILNFIRRFK